MCSLNKHHAEQKYHMLLTLEYHTSPQFDDMINPSSEMIEQYYHA